jgi:GTP-binding protein
MALKLAIVGRPNVGKSTLFNRLAGKKLAIVDDRPGVTRDRRHGAGRLGDLDLELIDTAGFENHDDESLAARMQRQMEQAIDAADVVALVVDAREGITPLDRVFVELLRRRDKPVLVLANKAEGRAANAGVNEAFTLGLGEPIAISAEHGEGMSDLYDALSPHAAEETPDDGANDAERPLAIAVIGRPNAGKSTLVNKLIGEDRMLTGPEAGITRDSIRVDWTAAGRRFRLVDTAGIRRKALVHERLEQLSVHDALSAVQLAEVVLLVMDATHPFEVQDLQLADLVEREGRALVFVLAKWDLVEDPAQRLTDSAGTAERFLPQLRGAPIVALSAETGKGLDRLIPAVLKLHGDWSTKVKTRDLNDWLKQALERHPPPAVKGRRVKPKYMAQTKSRPPTFVLMASAGSDLPESYRRYLVNSLRESFDLPGAPIRLIVRRSRNPYVDGDSPRARPKPKLKQRRPRASTR